MVAPPSTISSVPVMNDDSSEAREQHCVGDLAGLRKAAQRDAPEAIVANICGYRSVSH